MPKVCAGAGRVWRDGCVAAALMHGVTPLEQLWDTEEVDVAAGTTVVAAGQPQTAVY